MRPPARVIGMSARCPHRRALLTLCMGYRHRRALLTPARVISPSRCQQPPHDVNDPLTVPTTRVHTGRSTLARTGRAADKIDVDAIHRAHYPGARPRQGRARCGHGRQRASTPGGAPAPGPGTLRTRPTTPTARGHARTRARPQADCSGSRTTPSEYAHKDPDLRNTHRTQGRNQALVCDSVLPTPLCATPTETNTEKERSEGRTHRTNGEPTEEPTNQTSKTTDPRRKERLAARGTAPAPPGKPRPGTARTARGAAPAAPPYGSGFTARCRATMPPVRLRYWTSDQPLRAIMAPRARWSGHWRIDSTK